MQEDNDPLEILESIRAELRLIRAEVEHTREILEQRIDALERQGADHETRIRDASEGVTQFRLWSAISNGSSTLLSLTALSKLILGK